MASKPTFDSRAGRGVWRMKYRPDPQGPWVPVVLGKHNGPWTVGKKIKKPPQYILDRHHEFTEIEYRAKHGLDAAPARARGLAAYIEDYIEAFRKVKGTSSLKQLRRHTSNLVAFCAGKGIDTVQGVTRATCRDFLEHCAGRMNASTLQTMKGFLSPIWTRALEDGLVQASPWHRLKVPGTKQKSKATFWSSDEVGKIALACGKPWQRDLVLVLANTGIRISAVLAMRWDWINWSAGTITVPTEHSKSDKEYTIALSRGGRDVLQRRQAETGSELVFPNPYRDCGVIGYATARDAIDRAITKAGVKHGTPHDLRHTYGRTLALGGVPLPVISSQLGHSGLTMTQRYVETDETSAARFMEDFDLGGSPAED